MSRLKGLDFGRLHCIIGVMDLKQDVWLGVFFSFSFPWAPVANGSSRTPFVLIRYLRTGIPKMTCSYSVDFQRRHIRGAGFF